MSNQNIEECVVEEQCAIKSSPSWEKIQKITCLADRNLHCGGYHLNMYNRWTHRSLDCWRNVQRLDLGVADIVV